MKNVSLYPLQDRHVHLHKFIRGLFCEGLKTLFNTLITSLLFYFSIRMCLSWSFFFLLNLCHSFTMAASCLFIRWGKYLFF